MRYDRDLITYGKPKAQRMTELMVIGVGEPIVDGSLLEFLDSDVDGEPFLCSSNER